MLWDFTYGLRQALLLFPVLALVIALPFLAYQYSKYGSVNGWRSITLYSFVFYLVVAYFLVILPLPSKAYVSEMTSSYTQLKPFFFLELFRDRGLVVGGLSAWIDFIQTITFQQVFFNMLLFVPFGVYMRYYFKRGFMMTMLLSFALSLFFELTQLSALYGIYPRPYRIFDVDDLILNTLGGIVGYFVTPMIVFMFPTRSEMDEDSLSKAHQVSMGRRIVAALFDGLLMLGIGVIALIVFRTDLTLLELLNHPMDMLRRVLNHYDLLLVSMAFASLFMMLQVWLFKGKSLGKALVHIKLVQKDKPELKFGKIIIRYSIIFIEIALITGALALVLATRANILYDLDQPLIGLLLIFIVGTLLILDFLLATLAKTQMLHERLSSISNNAY